jgi:hypothetical protein
VCGLRRLAAMRQLGWKTANVWVRSGISDELGQLLAEQDEKRPPQAPHPHRAGRPLPRAQGPARRGRRPPAGGLPVPRRRTKAQIRRCRHRGGTVHRLPLGPPRHRTAQATWNVSPPRHSRASAPARSAPNTPALHQHLRPG